ncbi:polysaccharide lyase family 7 protein [Hyalangium rubrum]|uniref:Polysaccharide lyase family 7 protein n=1 Tax=Hyalangium rubrum TaxID=3103134 RepID=A0ABU5H1X2_9BACT|nr:polysaccharide lyase family 7 protein [Hyalangium sp. s54d21]MDY7227107.1 polysaccharide lyase family 7 protein [Hyalangium sp. s54d21]
MNLQRPLLLLTLSLLVAVEASAQSATKFSVPGSAVTASTYDAANNAVPTNAVDGNLSTRWAGQGDGANITFDLGAAQSVQFIKIAWHQGDTRTTTFDVLASASPSGPWTTLLNRSVSSGATTSFETYDFADTSARYVRIVGHGNSSGNGWNSITEVELWGAANTLGALPVPGSAVTASTYDTTNNAVPANAVDGNLGTRWAGQGDGANITFDLSATQSVRFIKIAWYQGNTRTTTFDVLAGDSTSGPWTTLISGGVSSGTTTSFETYDFADINARYVRIVGHGNSSGNGWNSISEVELWGVGSTAGQVATPSFSPAAGTYTSAQTVTLGSSTPGASIRYTTDGSTPSASTGTLYSGPVTISATTTLKAIAYQSGLTPSAVRSGTYTITASSGGLDPSAPPGDNFDLTHWKLTLPSASEISAASLSNGYELEGTFFTDPETGGITFRCPNLADTTANSSYSRTELREMLAPSGSASAAANNWVFSTSSSSAKSAAGGVDGTLRATLTVDHVSTTGESGKVGRVIVGQIHGPDSEPIRLYYHKRPSDSRGAIYFAHDTPSNSTSYHAIIGDPNNLNPSNGVLLGEKWSYEIKVVGQAMTVKVTPEGRATVTANFTLESGYNNLSMYFKAGVYNQNNTGTSSDYVQATFYSVTHTHP